MQKLGIDSWQENDKNSNISSTNLLITSDSQPMKNTLGPFYTEEDAVVGYWRFDEYFSSSSTNLSTNIVRDSSKRNNNGILLQNIGLNSPHYEESTTPVDQGDEKKVLKVNFLTV